jgi:spermidine synthase
LRKRQSFNTAPRLAQYLPMSDDGAGRSGVNKSRLFVVIFFLSGVAGVAYQVIWAKSLAAAIGHEYPAMLATVSAFMCGMAAGNFALARFRKISPSCYGWLEILIGLWAIAIPLLTPAVESIVFKLLGLTPSPFQHWVVVFAVVVLALLPATAAMGATLPAAEQFLSAAIRRPTTALLYGVNTAGAMLGALLAAFSLMPALGLRTSSFVLSAVNILCGLAALYLARNATATSTPVNPTQKAPAMLALRLFLTGAVGIGFEVAIVRGLSQVLENTVYTFAVVLAVYLGGTALGAFLYHRASSARVFKNPMALFAALSLASLVAAIALRWAATIYPSLRFSLGDSLPAVATAETLMALGLLLLPCVCMGAIWSWLAQSSLQFKRSLGWAVGINTMGAALGPILWGLGFIPLIGLKGALAAAPIAYAAMGGRTRDALITILIAICAIPFVTSNRQLIDSRDGRIISLREGVMGSVAAIESANGSRVLKLNNRFQMGGTAARIAEQRQADIPLLLHPHPKRALFIGLGTGISFATAAYYPNLIAEGVELVPEIANAIPLFNDSALKSTNLLTYIADGRRFVRATTNSYDVIVAELFHPAQDGVGFLYTREHFQAIRKRLAEGGLFCQWLPLHQIDLQTLDIISRTFETVFPGAQQWLLRFNIDTPVIGLIGWNGSRLRPLVEARALEHPALAEHLRSVSLGDSVRLFGCYLGESKFDPTGKLNTDDNPVVIFRAPSVTFQRSDDPAERLMSLIQAAQTESVRVPWQARSFSWTHPAETNLPAEIPKFIRARDIYLKGLVQEARGQREDALAAYIESAKTSAFFTAGYAQALTLATTLARSNPQSARAILQALIAAQPERPVARELLDRLENRN